MVHQNKDHHQEADKKGALSGIPSYLVSQIRGYRELPLIIYSQQRNRVIDLVVFQIVVKVDLLLYFLFHADETDLLVPLSLTLDFHHDVVTSIRGKVLKNGMVGEVNELIRDLFAIV